ncbi:Calponin family repeat-containing domain protein [Aphelenchoides besseyi]|nr:Calponin family repeat-containing domain protein [Aphelenchoides besseyi]
MSASNRALRIVQLGGFGSTEQPQTRLIQRTRSNRQQSEEMADDEVTESYYEDEEEGDEELEEPESIAADKPKTNGEAKPAAPAAEKTEAKTEDSAPAVDTSAPKDSGLSATKSNYDALKSPTPGANYAPPSIPKSVLRKQELYSSGKPSTQHSKEKLMRSEGIIPIQAGSNKFASQKGQTGFGMPRDVIDKVKSENLKEITDEKKIESLKKRRVRLGFNPVPTSLHHKKGQSAFGAVRDVNYRPKGTGGASEVPEEKARLTDGIVPLQSGTNKLASQKGMSPIGGVRIVDVRKTIDQERDSQGFIHLQMGTNRFANQSGMTGFGMPRHNITKYKDEVRGEMPHDESSTSRQTSGWKEGANQVEFWIELKYSLSGMTGFGAFRNNTIFLLQNQDQRSQGLIPYQMGVNFLDSQAGKTPFGAIRKTYTPFVDDSHEDLPPELARDPSVPFWSGQEDNFANQTGMTSFGTPRDVRGEYVRRMW